MGILLYLNVLQHQSIFIQHFKKHWNFTKSSLYFSYLSCCINSSHHTKLEMANRHDKIEPCAFNLPSILYNLKNGATLRDLFAMGSTHSRIQCKATPLHTNWVQVESPGALVGESSPPIQKLHKKPQWLQCTYVMKE